ncbi:hypothetical protein QJS04_geneDACA000900 [Acorus gramineus]|uniref:Uncharacterized protein n=1 Tax=Acorus gramineus TaxID=55184 RepID=A0AAV9AF78_ACOGR|nr:hypothetical protein QJS04_geneDACA000900 [Acorus gramineus]
MGGGKRENKRNQVDFQAFQNKEKEPPKIGYTNPKTKEEGGHEKHEECFPWPTKKKPCSYSP